MKAHLTFPDRDFDMSRPLPPQAHALIQDLELTTLFAAMAREDKWLAEVVQMAVLSSMTDVETILYRQQVLQDCLAREAVVREIYGLVVETIETVRKNSYGWGSHYPTGALNGAVNVLQMAFDGLQKLRGLADLHAEKFHSEGFNTLFAMLRRELSDDYLASIRQHLKRLKFPRGLLMSARLGQGHKGTGYVLRKENPPAGTWLDRMFAPRPPSCSYKLAERDDAGARALSELRDRGVNLVANATAQSTHHIMSFFRMLRAELAFYVGCLNLHGELSALGERVCFPVPGESGTRKHVASELYDPCLALNRRRKVVGNDLAADGKVAVVITGANQGGKSTFLRSIGLAQLMMQCGMFVAARALSANIAERIFTHFKREEDAAMNSGKLDEELSRMSDIATHAVPNSLVLFNESFAATNEREGSEIARQVTTALMERRIKTVFVTHQYEFAEGLHALNLPIIHFLRAERRDDGTRTFRITEGRPLPTSYGQDLYRQIFAPAVAMPGDRTRPTVSGLEAHP